MKRAVNENRGSMTVNLEQNIRNYFDKKYQLNKFT